MPKQNMSETRRRWPSMVLIVDDHDHSRSAGRLVLEDAGFAVCEARSGFEALALAQYRQPRVMLMDLVLPGIDGLQLTRMLRADPTMRHCAIIAVTAYAGTDSRDAALDAGCDDFLAKPIAAAHLVELVRRYARRGITSALEGGWSAAPDVAGVVAPVHAPSAQSLPSGALPLHQTVGS